jgi:hypothetical protein
MHLDSVDLKTPYSLALRQSVLLTFFSLLCVNQVLFAGLGLVGPTYNEAALRFASGMSPYLAPSAPGAEWYHYPPLFIWLYWPLTLLPPVAHGAVWMAINIFVFWFGISRWQILRPSDKKNFKWMLLFVLLCGMELECAVRARQANPLFVGCILLGVRDYMERRDWGAGTWLMLGTGIKVLPIVIAALLFFPIRRRFWIACVCMGIVVVLLPSLTLGLKGITLFFTWAQHVQSNVMPEFGQGDIASALYKLGVEKPIALFFRHSILAITVVVAILNRLKGEEDFPWEMWLSLGLLALVLCSPKTEDQTFVLFAPICLLFGRHTRNQFLQGNRWPLVGYIASVFLVSFLHNDLFLPRLLWSGFRYQLWTKPFGALIAWFWVVTPLIIRLVPHFSRAPASISSSNVPNE